MCNILELSEGGSRIFQSQLTFFDLNIARIASAIFLKSVVASARMVGPALDKQIPQRPG